jgi:hypothetical protein
MLGDMIYTIDLYTNPRTAATWFNRKFGGNPKFLKVKTLRHIVATYLLLMIWFCFVVVVVWNGVEAAKSNGK